MASDSGATDSANTPAFAPPPPPAPPRPVAPTKKRAAPTNQQSSRKMAGFAPLPTAESSKNPSSKLNNRDAKETKQELEEAAQAVAPDLTPEIAKVVVDIRFALAGRDLETARKHLISAAAKAQTDSDRNQIDRLKTILDHLTQFWEGIQASMTKLQAAEEIVIKDTRIVVVDSGKDLLSVKVAGKVHRFKIKTMPTSLVMALVNRNFGKDTGSKAIIGAFLAVDPSGDRSLARQYWNDAADDGIDTEKLLPEIDAMPPVVRRNDGK